MADGSVSTLSNPVTGTGTTNYLPKFTGSTTIGNSNIISDGSGKFSLGTAATHGNATFEQTTGEVGLVVNSSIAESPTIYLRDAGGAGYSTILANNNLYLNASRILVGTTSDNGAKLQVSGTATFSGNVVLGTTALSGGGAAQWLTANGTSYGGGLISSVSGVVKAYYYYDSSTNAAMVQAVAGVGVQLWANATVALSIASTGAATFSGQLHIPNNSTGTGGGLYFDYNANAASRNWQIVSDYDVYGDFQIRQSTTQTGSTYSKILGFSPTGAATFSSSVTAGENVNIYSSVIPSIVALTPTFWGYSSSYPVVMLGSSASASTVAIGYNPSGNANGSFTGNGDEILFRNGAKFTTPNSANNSFYLNHLVLKDGNVLIGTTTDSAGRLRVKSAGNDNYAIAFERSNATTTIGGFYQNSTSGGEMFLVASNGSQNVKISSTQFSYWAAPGVNFAIGTSIDSTDKLRVNGTTFTNEIMTWNPENDNRSGVAWRLGAASIASITPNRRLRVSVGGVEYYIGAVEV
jgi:hypothetical protein